MIVTLEEAIAREEEIATRNERYCAVAPPEMTAEEYHAATYHRQIAEWLKEVAGRKTGKWIVNRDEFGNRNVDCSVCGKGFFTASGIREKDDSKILESFLMTSVKPYGIRYCPYCGVKMEVEA